MAKKRRRESALERLKESQFFEKGTRTQEAWQKNKDRMIETLEKRVRL